MHQVSTPLGLIWSDLKKDRLFLAGLLVKLILISVFVPLIQSQWFLVFLVHTIENITADPWSNFLIAGGDPLSFPYGPVMLMSLLPTTLAGWGLDSIIGVNFFSGLGFRLGLLGADILLLLLLLQQFNQYRNKIILFYWLSPLFLFITYWHGQIDIIPVVLFILSLSMLKQKKQLMSGIVMGLAVAAKHSMLVGVPFVFLYLWFGRGITQHNGRFLLGFFAVLLFESILLFSNGFSRMVVRSPEADNLFWLSMSMGDSLKVYVVPIIYLLLLYSAWRIRRMNYDLLMATLGVAFSIVILLSPSPPGWYVWLLPIYSLHQSRNKNASLLVALFSIVFIFYHLMNSSGSEIVGINYYPIQLFQEWTLELGSKFQSSIYSLMLGLAGLIALQILRDGIRGNDSYRLGKKPFVIGVAGFYSTGKDIFNNSLANLFGKRSAIEICGKDYYHWDQSSPMWKTVTHYNPKSSRLFDMTNDLRELLLGGEIKAKSYDVDGYHPMAIRKNHTIVVVNSMYALFSRKLIQMQDIHFFVEVDEKLDNYLQLKADKVAGYSQSLKIINDIDKSASDIKAFIEPQKETADVIFSIDYINSDLLDASHKSSNLRLRVTIQDGMYYQKMMKVLIGICGLEFKVNRLNNDGKVELEIYGDVKAGDLHLSSGVLIPNLIELIDGEKGFKDGVFGLMQLIALMEINERIAKRIEVRESYA